MELVGIHLENGNGEMGGKNKYKRMSSELTEDEGFDHQKERTRSTRKYVFACAVFASLNSVLLGYGEPLSLSLSQSNQRAY